MSAISPDHFRPKQTAAQIAFSIKHYQLDGEKPPAMPRANAASAKPHRESFGRALNDDAPLNSEAQQLAEQLDALIRAENLRDEQGFMIAARAFIDAKIEAEQHLIEEKNSGVSNEVQSLLIGSTDANLESKAPREVMVKRSASLDQRAAAEIESGKKRIENYRTVQALFNNLSAVLENGREQSGGRGVA